MIKTNLQRRKSYYDRIIEEGMKSPFAQYYKAVCESISDLVVISNKLKDPNHIMEPDEFKELKTKYEIAKNKCDEYLKGSNDFTSFEKNRMPIITEISKVLAKDLKEIGDYNPKSLRTLSQVIKKARTHTVVLNKDDIKTVGGELSSRVPIQTASRKKGFFTPKKVFNLDAKWTEKIESFKAEYEKVFGKALPTNAIETLELLKTDENLRRNKICRKISHRPIPEKLRGTEQLNKAVLIPLSRELGLGDSDEAVSQLLSEKDGALRNVMFDFVQSIVPFSFEEVIMNMAGIKKNSNISSRNCAM